MRILIQTLNYKPELTGIGKYSAEMAEWLTKKGHNVRVITAPPYYPEWKIGENYSGRQYLRERIEGVEVWRCPIWIPKNPSGFKRLCHLASFALTSSIVMVRQLFWHPQVIITIEPPFMCAPTALIAAKLTGASSWIHIQDYEIDAAFSLGILKSKNIRDIILKLESLLLQKFNIVSTISKAMTRKAQEKGVLTKNIHLIPNWADTEKIFPNKTSTALNKSTFGVPTDKTLVLYSGNLGEKQGIDIIIDVARLLIHNNIHFIICGEGPSKERLLMRSDDLPNITFLPLQPLEHLNDLLNLADIHLLPQRTDAEDLVMPSKLTGILACGGPVIATASPSTELSNVVTDAGGIVCPPGDAETLSNLISSLSKDEHRRKIMANYARSYAEEHLSKEAILERANSLLTSQITKKITYSSHVE
ncbi:D-inositol 3-phosphate glycosyltransferase [compost metagenome]